MKGISFYNDALKKENFRVDYPYLGLFGSADITPIYNEDEVLYKCKLLNGSTIFLKKLFQSKKWIDASLQAETPLSATIGPSIDDFLRIKKGA